MAGPGSTVDSVGVGGGVPAPAGEVEDPAGGARSTMSTMTCTGSALLTATLQDCDVVLGRERREDCDVSCISDVDWTFLCIVVMCTFKPLAV